MKSTLEERTGNLGYEVIIADTYARGVAKLRELGELPKMFKENIEARVTAYENGDRELFNIWLDSCTAVVNKKRSTKFKIVPKSKDLITIPENFNGACLPVAYAGVKNGIGLDSSKGKYNQPLSEGEPLVHKGWLAAVEDKSLLKAYHNIIFKGFKQERAMGFYVRENTPKDELRALFVGGLGGYSYAGGYGYLNGGGPFLRGSPVVSAKKTGTGLHHGK